jgi:hypothetical protein
MNNANMKTKKENIGFIEKMKSQSNTRHRPSLSAFNL